MITRNVKRNLVLVVSSMTLINLFMNCTGFEDNSSSFAPSATIASKAERQHYTIQSSEQLARSLASVTNVEYNSTIINEYNARKALMSTDYELDSVTAPMLVSISNLSSQFCGELIRKEAALTVPNRIYFSNIDLSRGLLDIQDAQFNLGLDVLSLKFWGRALTDEERIILNDAKSEFITATPAASRTSSTQTRNLMISTCTVMLSSFDFITI